MSVWVVSISGHINSVWAQPEGAFAHVKHLRDVNGDRIAVKVQELEVRS